MTTIVTQEETNGAKFLRAAKWADFFVLTNCLAVEIGDAEARSFDYPKWVQTCGRKVTRALFPRIYRSVEGKTPSRAYDAGLAVGLLEYGQQVLAAIAEEIGPIPEAEVSDENLKRFWHELYGEDWKTYTFSDTDILVPSEIRQKIAEMQQRFNLAQQADYHQGFADVIRMMAGENKETATTEIYTLMLVFWRLIERLPTFEVFFDLMTKIFGHNRTGSDPKRLGQMCQRIGKRFRLPGRPPKQPQSSTSVEVI